MNVCGFCEKEFVAADYHRRIFCSNKCKVRANNRSKRFATNEAQFAGKIEGKEYVVCAICTLKSRNLASHVSRGHKMKTSEYQAAYPGSLFACTDALQEMSERVKGDKNPAYEHGGKYSPFSKHFIHYTETSIDDVRKKSSETKQANPHNESTKIEYYLAQGLSQKEAEKALSERQSTFNLKKCIATYGEEEGKKVWQARQDKWQGTLNQKSEEERDNINRRKLAAIGCVSKAETAIFEKMKEFFPDATPQFMLREGTRYFYYDFRVGKILVEYNGDYWHANPEIYEKDHIFLRGRDEKVTAAELWAKDRKKLNCALDNGFEVYTIWEKDYKADPLTTMAKCLKYLFKCNDRKIK